MAQKDKMNFEKLVIRTAGAEDMEGLAQVETACFSVPWSKKALEESLETGRSLYLAAEYEGEVIGECGVHFVCGEGEITNVAVLHRFRTMGVGNALLEELLKQGEALGIRDFTLEVRAGNLPAIRLYEKFGFKTEGIRRNFYEKPREDAMIMWKRQAMHETITTEISDFSLYNRN